MFRAKNVAHVVIGLTAVLAVFGAGSQAAGAIPTDERDALIALYNSTGGASWADQTNWLGSAGTECTWYGVSCDAGDTTVTALFLDSNQLSGTIPTQIGALTALGWLVLASNQLGGSIPTQIGNLTNLTHLYLFSNQLSGSIPTQIGNLSSLESLHLESNQLSGSIPTQIANPAALAQLDLSSNQLGGSIPTQIGNLTNLTSLNLSSNQLSGSIPTQIGNPTALDYLNLRSNLLSGSIPTEVGSLTNLGSLSMDSNLLSGTIPTQIGNLTALYALNLDSNQLAGGIPTQLGNLLSLDVLWLSSNQLTGNIPTELLNLPILRLTDLRWNALHTSDSALRSFLNGKQDGGDWESTQTIAPMNAAASVAGPTSVLLTWTPIAYTGDMGGYRVSYGTVAGGPYSVFTTTPTKAGSSLQVTGLTPSTPYYFIIETVTEPHSSNQNTVVSEPTSEIARATLDVLLFPCASVDNCNLSFQTYGDAPWVDQTAVKYYGTSAAQSGNIGDLQASSFSTVVAGPGSARFYWRVSSEQTWDYLRFYVDGVENGSGITGEVDWTQRTARIPPGTHTLHWTYSKDGSLVFGSDAGWVDRVEYIRDDDATGVVQLKSAAYSVTEAGPAAVIIVTRAAVGASGLGGTATVGYATSDGTATAGSDYTASSGTLTFGPNQTQKAFQVPILQDTLDEAHETVNLTLLNPGPTTQFGTRTTGTLTILDDERTVQFALAETRISEGAPQAVITVKRSGVTTGSLTVDYAIADGTATAGADYRSATGTLTFGPGVLSRTFAVPLIADTLDEPDETVLLGLRNPVGGSIGSLGSAVLTILDNDVAGTVQLTAPATIVLESVGTALVKVSRSGGTASGVTVSYQTADGTATAGSDYTATAGTLTFAAGQTTQTITIPILGDALTEGSETVNVTLTGVGGGGILGPRVAGVLTIVDDEATVELTSATYTAKEGTPVAVQVRCTGSPGATVTVHYSTSNGTATAGRDFVAKTGVLTFTAGGTKPLPIATINDTLAEGDETFGVTLDTPTNAVLGGVSSAVGTITDNDTGGVIELLSSTITVLESAPAATITVKRTGGVASGALVDFATGDGTATAPGDYGAVAGTLTFNAGQLSQTVKVPIVNDTEAENAETVLLTLSNPRGGATLGPKATGVLSIQDNDGPYFAFLKPTYTIAESGRVVTLTAKRVGTVTGTTTVGYRLVDGTATAGSDYTAAATGTLTFASGQGSRSVVVTINNDTEDEPAETFSAILENPQAGYHLGAPNETVVTITDNDIAGVIRFGSAVYSASEGEDGTSKLVSVTVTRSGGTSSGATIDYATADGTATDGTDYDAATGTVTFGVSQTSRSFTVRVYGDGEVEGNESVPLTLSNPGGGATLGTPSQATLWITEPTSAVKVVIAGDSVMQAWLSDTGGGLAEALLSHNYFVSATDAEWGPGAIGARTDLGQWWEWLRGPESEGVLSALLSEHQRGVGRFPRLADPDLERPNEIVVLQSSLASARLAGKPDDDPIAGENPLAGQDAQSPEMTVANAKALYLDLLEAFAAHPETLFVIVTPPPATAARMTAQQATNARSFHTWLVREWLTGYTLKNVVVFDLFNVLTSNGGAPTLSDAGLDTGSHHRIWEGAVQHVAEPGQNLSAYPTGPKNALPTPAGLRKATEELLPLLNLAVNRWKAELHGTEGQEIGAEGLPLGPTPLLSPADIAPPGGSE